jgi:hypothetical protein
MTEFFEITLKVARGEAETQEVADFFRRYSTS